MEQWREKEPGEWWLVYEEMPEPLGEQDERGVWHPPVWVVSFAHDDGLPSNSKPCLHLYAYEGGAWMPGDKEADPDYLHICEIDEAIERLTGLRDALAAKAAG